MADWKMPMSYNFSPSYHAYAYGLMYQQNSEHGHLNWTEAAYAHSGGVNSNYYANPAGQQSPPWSPENNTPVNYSHYPGHTQTGRLFLSCNKPESDPKSKETEQAGSDTPSDSEAHTPDSWSSGSSREGPTLSNLNIASWQDQDYETDSGSPDGVENSVSVVEEPAHQNVETTHDPVVNASPVRPMIPPRKPRASFSEDQMAALIHRFNAQRYLTPAEMKTLAAGTGLTYKQVKTWFQNRRMKLKRHQRDGGWMTERYVINGLQNTRPQFQKNSPQTNQDSHGNPPLSETGVFKRSPQQTPCYPRYPQQRSPPQATMRPQGNWPLPPAVTHYEFPKPSYMQPHANAGNDGSRMTAEEDNPSPASYSIPYWSTKGATLQ